MTRQHRVGIDVRQYDEAAFGEGFHGFQRLDGVGQQVAGVGVDLQLDPLEPGGFADESDPDRLVGIARAGSVEHDLDPGAVDDLQNVVVLCVVFMDAGQCHGNEFRFRGGQRLFEDFR